MSGRSMRPGTLGHHAQDRRAGDQREVEARPRLRARSAQGDEVGAGSAHVRSGNG